MCACGQISRGGGSWSRLPQLKWPNAAAETVSSVLLSVAAEGKEEVEQGVGHGQGEAGDNYDG